MSIIDGFFQAMEDAAYYGIDESDVVSYEDTAVEDSGDDTDV